MHVAQAFLAQECFFVTKKVLNRDFCFISDSNSPHRPNGLPAVSQTDLRVCLQPQNLLGALWLQFAASVDVLKSFLKCALCDAPFEISRDPRTGKRTDARFCSARCRVNHYRSRIERARRLRAAGRSEVEIARELKAQLSTVRAWLLESRGLSRTRPTLMTSRWRIRRSTNAHKKEESVSADRAIGTSPASVRTSIWTIAPGRACPGKLA
jgi:hypothetical protein